jgi:hypothetical protein
MLLLTATAETQGQLPGDFCDAIEGELLVILADCPYHPVRRRTVTRRYRRDWFGSASWYVLTDSIRRSCDANGIRHQDLAAYVSLGTGREVRAAERGIGFE